MVSHVKGILRRFFLFGILLIIIIELIYCCGHFECNIIIIIIEWDKNTEAPLALGVLYVCLCPSLGRSLWAIHSNDQQLSGKYRPFLLLSLSLSLSLPGRPCMVIIENG